MNQQGVPGQSGVYSNLNPTTIQQTFSNVSNNLQDRVGQLGQRVETTLQQGLNNVGQQLNNVVNRGVNTVKTGIDQGKDVVEEGLEITREYVMTMSPRLKRLGWWAQFCSFLLLIHYIAPVLLSWSDVTLFKYRVHVWFLMFLILAAFTYYMNKNVGLLGSARWSVVYRTGALLNALLALGTFGVGTLYLIKAFIDVGIINKVQAGTFVYTPGAENITGLIGPFSPDVAAQGTFALWIVILILGILATVVSLVVAIINVIIATWATPWNTAILREDRLRSALQQYIDAEKLGTMEKHPSRGVFSDIAEWVVGVEGVDMDVVQAHPKDHDTMHRFAHKNSVHRYQKPNTSQHNGNTYERV